MHTAAEPDTLWQILQREAQVVAAQEPVLASYIHGTILHHQNLVDAISFHLANLLDSSPAPALLLREVFLDALQQDPTIIRRICRDIIACYERDAACDHYLMPLLYCTLVMATRPSDVSLAHPEPYERSLCCRYTSRGCYWRWHHDGSRYRRGDW